MQRYLTARTVAGFHYRRVTRLQPDPTAHAIAAVLGEPETAARHIARASYVQNRSFDADYDWLAKASASEAARRLHDIRFERADELRNALLHRRQPLIVAVLHMGHYVTALLRLLTHIPELSDLAVIKRAAHSTREDAAYRHLAPSIRLQILRLDQRPLRPALTLLRRGGALVTMIDVPPTFGTLKTQPTQWFGHPGHLPIGPATIAVTAGALVLPISTWPAGTSDALECAAFIDARLRDGECRAQAITRVHDTLAAQCAAWIRAHPGQWMLWSHIGAFFAPPTTAIEDQSAQ